jgi:plastocyanin
MRKIAVAVAMVAVLFGACGKNDNPSVDNAGAPAAASIDVTTKDFQFADFPATVTVDNLAKLTLKNEGTENHEAAILKLTDRKTVDDVKAFLGSKTPSGPPPFAVAGGLTATAPGTSASVTQALPAGSYAFICYVAGQDGVPHFAKGMLAGFAVTGNSTTSLPLPDGVNATGKEFHFDLPALKAGTTTIRFTNSGTQDHVLGFAKLADGKTADDALKWLKDHQGPPPLTFMGGPAAGPGGSNSFQAKLSKGTYVFYCPVPDTGPGGDNQPHFTKGMFQGVSIS